MKIKTVHIESFRGIPQALDLDFTDKNGKPISAIIYGDNGTGKSSIVDAIEFGLQARIEREQSIQNKKRPSVISKAYATPIGAKISIELDNSVQINRNINVILKDNYYKLISTDNKPYKGFSIVPIVLRRNDIMTYNIISSVERQILFFKFIYKKIDFYGSKEQAELFLENSPEVEELMEEITRLKAKREQLKRTLADRLGISPRRISINTKDAIDICIKRSVVPYNGNPRQRTQGRKVVSTEEYQEIQRIAHAIEERRIEISLRKQELNKIKTTSLNKSNKRIQQNIAFFQDAAVYLTDAFNKISSTDYVEEFNLSYGNKSAVSLDIIIKLRTGLKTTPSQIFSEANYDLMILLLYVSVIRVGSKYGQEKVIILDDVLQSVDSQIRNKFVSYLLSEMKDWQIFITVHDRLWLNQLRFLFTNSGHMFNEMQCDSWDFEHGPTIRTNKTKLYDDSLEIAIKSGSTSLMASTAGLMLEKICQNLSIDLAISIHRRRDDKYTIGDLWPGLFKIMKASPEFKVIVEGIDESLYIRNLLGSHYNEWATSLSDQEIREFAFNVQKLYDYTFCKKCLSWISITNKTNSCVAQCNCHHTYMTKK